MRRGAAGMMRLENPSIIRRKPIVLTAADPMQVEQEVETSWCRWSEARWWLPMRGTIHNTDRHSRPKRKNLAIALKMIRQLACSVKGASDARRDDFL
jgi:hypothetical protein